MRITLAWAEQFELFRTVDLSAGGALVVGHVPETPIPEVGSLGECAFNIDSLEVRVDMVVVRISKSGAVAVKFVGLPRALEDRIVAWVFRLQAQALSRRF